MAEQGNRGNDHGALVAEAESFKSQGNQAYASKLFPEAIRLYTAAHNLLPSEPVFLSNRAAAHFEAGDYAASLADDAAALALLEGDVNADVSKGLQLQEKVLNRARKAALQRKDWGLCKRMCTRLIEVEALSGGGRSMGLDTCQLLDSLDLEADAEMGERFESLPNSRASLTSDFGYYPVGHEDPNGLIQVEELELIEVPDLAKGEKLSLHLLFGACGDPRHVMQSFYELDSILSDQPQIETDSDGSSEWEEEQHTSNSEEEEASDKGEDITSDRGKEDTSRGQENRSNRGEDTKSNKGHESRSDSRDRQEEDTSNNGREESKKWANVSLVCDMNDSDLRILARNVLLLMLLRDVGAQAHTGCSQDGGAVLEKLRWQIKFVDAVCSMEKDGEQMEDVMLDYMEEWEDTHPGQDRQVFFTEDFLVGAHFTEEDVVSGELLYKVWLSCNLTSAESDALGAALDSLLKASISLASWQSNPQHCWIEFCSPEDLAALRPIWRAWREFGRTKGESAGPKGFEKTKLRQMVRALKEDAPMMTRKIEDLTKAAQVEMDSWQKTGLTSSYADVMAGKTKLEGMAVNPTMLNEITPEGKFVAKPPHDNPWNSGPESLFYRGGVFLVVPTLKNLPAALGGFDGMTCLQFYLWSQALSRLLSRGANVRVRVLSGSICARTRASAETSYDRIHTTNIIDYIGPLNLLTSVGSKLKQGCPHAAIKTDVLLNLGLYLKEGSGPTRVFDLDFYLQRELLLSREEFADVLGYDLMTSPDDFAEPTYLLPTRGKLPGSARLSEWLQKTLAHILLPQVSEEPRPSSGPKCCSVLEPRGPTMGTFLNLLTHLVEHRGVSRHWVAERLERLLHNQSELWHTELVVATSLHLQSLPFFPASKALLPVGSLKRHTLHVPLFPWAIIGGEYTGNPQLALLVISPEESEQAKIGLEHATRVSGDALRRHLLEWRGKAHLFSNLSMSKPDKELVSTVEVWLPKKWTKSGTGKAIMLRIDRYQFVSDFVEMSGD